MLWEVLIKTRVPRPSPNVSKGFWSPIFLHLDSGLEIRCLRFEISGLGDLQHGWGCLCSVCIFLVFAWVLLVWVSIVLSFYRGFSPPFLVALLCCFVISGCYWLVLFCLLFLLLLSGALGDPDGRTLPLYISFFALVACRSSLVCRLAVCLCCVCLLVVLLVFFVLAIAWFRSPPSLLCVASLCVPSRGWMRGGFCLFSCVLLKRVSVDGLAQACLESMHPCLLSVVLASFFL